jgi:uncharacterized protein (DUF4415 family)
MAKNWPSFVTKDLGDSPADSIEMERRWKAYRDEMNILITTGGIHRDTDGWWVDDATGELIGPDPEIERPMTEEESLLARPLVELLPDLASKMRRTRGKQKTATKVSTTIRLDEDVLAKFRATGPGWQSRMNDMLRKAAGL